MISPEGSIFNPTFPAACQSRFSQCQRLVDLISAALAPVIPDKVTAGCGATLSAFAYSGVRPGGDYWILVEINESAYGGRPASDGPDSIDELMRNTRNNPIEDLGMHLPLICDRYELRDDVPPGAGRYRGGLGIVKVQRFLTPGYVVHEADRHEDVPWGFLGGEPGTVGKLEQWNVATPEEVVSWPAKVPATPTETGDCIAVYTPVAAATATRWSDRPIKCGTMSPTATSAQPTPTTPTGSSWTRRLRSIGRLPRHGAQRFAPRRRSSPRRSPRSNLRIQYYRETWASRRLRMRRLAISARTRGISTVR